MKLRTILYFPELMKMVQDAYIADQNFFQKIFFKLLREFALFLEAGKLLHGEKSFSNLPYFNFSANKGFKLPDLKKKKVCFTRLAC